MGNPIVHFEIIGRHPDQLQNFYGNLFGWEFDTGAPTAPGVSDDNCYGFVSRNTTADGTGIPGGVGGGNEFAPSTLFYVGVDNVEYCLKKAEAAGATVVYGPEPHPNGNLVVGHFRDPEGNLIGLAGPL